MAHKNWSNEHHHGEPQPGTLRHLFETEFAPARLANRAAQTHYQYVLNFQRFDAYLRRPAVLADLTEKNVMGCVAWLQKKHGLSISSAGKFRDNMAHFWKFLHQHKLIDTWPELPTIQEPIKTPTAWTKGQLQTLYEFLLRLPGEVSGIPANWYFVSLTCVLWDTGERIGPILQLKWSDVDLEERWIVIRGATRKMGLQDNLARLHPETVALLRKILAPERDLVFPWPWSNSLLYATWRDILTRAGLPTGRDRMFHCLRKSCASHAKALGMNPAEILRHLDPAMAERVYVDPRIAPKLQASDVLFRLHGRDELIPQNGEVPGKHAL
jgi:integrase